MTKKRNYYLSIDTCCGICSIAIGYKEKIHNATLDSNIMQILYEKIEYINNKQVENLIPMIIDALKNINISFEDLTGIVINIGPGSFTGIRVGLAAVKGIELALNSTFNAKTIKIIPISTLSSMAMHHSLLAGKKHFINEEFIFAIDAGKNEAYTQTFAFIPSQYFEYHESSVYFPFALNEITLLSIQDLYSIDSSSIKNTDNQSYDLSKSIHLFSYGKNDLSTINISSRVFPNAIASLYYYNLQCHFRVKTDIPNIANNIKNIIAEKMNKSHLESLVDYNRKELELQPLYIREPIYLSA